MAYAIETQRRKLLDALRQSGIHDERVLRSIARTPREQFVDATHRELAYTDCALPIGMGQTISQPYIVALMTQALRLSGQERVLEIGTGSGYQTAILAQLAAQVYSVERLQQLAYEAVLHLERLGIHNVSLFVGDGSRGWADAAPYERILVTAAAPAIPLHLLRQLEMGDCWWCQWVVRNGRICWWCSIHCRGRRCVR